MVKRVACAITSDDDSVTIVKTPGGPCCDSYDLSAAAASPNLLARMEQTFTRLDDDVAGTQTITCISADDNAPFRPKSLTLHLGRTGNITQVGSFGQAILTDGDTVLEQGIMYAFADTTSRSYIGLIGYAFVTAVGTWQATLINSGSVDKVKLDWVDHPTFGGLGITCSIIIHGVKI